jgi:uncharacterized protein YecE (DUF72 family)
LRPCESIRPNVGIHMFEFSKFYPGDFEHGHDFVSALDVFFSKLPTDWPYGVEMRNKYWLKPEYFECLAKHNVTHVFNSWTDMPPVGEQMALSGNSETASLTAARFLLKPGRAYEQAVKTFEPYNETKEVNHEARAAGAALIRRGKKNAKAKTFLFINNRLEGNALNTIRAMLDMAELGEADREPIDKAVP